MIWSRLLLFALVSGLVSIVPAAERPGYTIKNTANTFDPEQTIDTGRGYQYWFADPEFANGNTLKMSVVRPHTPHPEPHTHPQDEFFFVLEGTAEFFLNGETTTAGPMTSFYCPPNSLHGIRNVGDSELKYLVIENYNRGEMNPGGSR